MKQWEISKTVYTVGDFVSWQESKSLNLRPDFQRKSVWKKGAKSFLLDTIVRGLPIPIILIRERRESGRFEPIRDVVDGQQRLITIISYVAKNLISSEIDPNEEVLISKNHNKEFGGVTFANLPEETRTFILNYKFSVHILPADMGDREILEIFSRMNSTGTKLNSQELRNAGWFGELKSSIYSASYTHYEDWIEWETFTTSKLSRMADAEFTSELFLLVINGLSGKEQRSLNDFYEKYDEKFKERKEVEKRFENVMSHIEKDISDKYDGIFLSSPSYFYGLFSLVYNTLYILKSPLKATKAKKLSQTEVTKIIKRLKSFDSAKLPKKLNEEILKRRLNTEEFRKNLYSFLCK